jgi:hypothetical protein
MVSVNILVDFPLNSRRSTGACTPANPAPPPFGAGRRGSTIRHPKPLEGCACRSATRRARSHAKRCPAARSWVAPAKPPPRTAALRRHRRRPRLHAFQAVRSAMSGQDRVPLHLMKPVHRGPMDRDHGPVHGILSPCIRDPWLSRAV